MKIPFGHRFRETVESQHVEVAYNPDTQSADLTDAQLADLAASDNTLTFTAGSDNDFDEG